MDAQPAGRGRGGARSRTPTASSVVATELTAEEAAPVLKGALEHYLSTPMRPFLQRYYAPSADGRIEDYRDVATHHPVFRLRDAGS